MSQSAIRFFLLVEATLLILLTGSLAAPATASSQPRQVEAQLRPRSSSSRRASSSASPGKSPPTRSASWTSCGSVRLRPLQTWPSPRSP